MYIELLDLSLLELIVRLALGLVIGFSIGLTGIGGGVLMLPALSILLGYNPVQAVGTTSLYAFLTKIYATFHHARLRTIDWGVAARFLAGAIPSSMVVSLWVSRQGANVNFQQNLKLFIVGMVLFSVIMMLLNLSKQSPNALENKERNLSARISGHPLIRNGLGFLTGAVIGGLVGATSIQGVIIIPSLIIVFNLTAGRTVGTSIFIAMVLTLVMAIIYGKGGEANKTTAVIMAAGSLAGVYYGSRLSTRLPERLLKMVVITLVFAAAVMMLVHR